MLILHFIVNVKVWQPNINVTELHNFKNVIWHMDVAILADLLATACSKYLARDSNMPY